ncbi:MAG: type II toxin-antitoxin system VapC family toxin [Symploca sp. SIO3E6]|nr:type II toxin-antitoxin system VapC family toxin [Caldora sp. SIO3E6]
MEWLDQLQDKVVGLDTAPLIYFVEENFTYLRIVEAFFLAFERGHFQIITSTVTLLEVLVQPLRTGNLSLASQYRDILLNQNRLSVVSVSPEIAELSAQLRADYALRTPDSIQLATAINEGAASFLTNARRLAAIPHLEILVLDQLLYY